MIFLMELYIGNNKLFGNYSRVEHFFFFFYLIAIYD